MEVDTSHLQYNFGCSYSQLHLWTLLAGISYTRIGQCAWLHGMYIRVQDFHPSSMDSASEFRADSAGKSVCRTSVSSAASVAATDIWNCSCVLHSEVEVFVEKTDDVEASSPCMPRDPLLRDLCLRLQIPRGNEFRLFVVGLEDVRAAESRMLQWLKDMLVRIPEGFVMLVPDCQKTEFWRMSARLAGNRRYLYDPSVPLFEALENAGYWAMWVQECDLAEVEEPQGWQYQKTKSATRRARRRLQKRKYEDDQEVEE